MIKISKSECEYLLETGAKWGDDLHHTYTKHKTYYMTESKRNMNKLNKYRNYRGDK